MIKSKSELTDKINLIDSESFSKFDADSSSDGCCAKYTDGDRWVKLDKNGYEALAEIISCRVAKALGLSTVIYEPCIFYLEDLYYTGCISDSYLPKGYSELTLGRLLCQKTEACNLDELMKIINRYQIPVDRIGYVLNTVSDQIDREVLKHYLAEMLWFDSIIYNGDRHLHNILLFQTDAGSITRAPLFDFGDGLLSNTSFKYPLTMTAAYGVYKVKSKPFSTTFSKQVECLMPCLQLKPPEKISISMTDLYDYYSNSEISRALSVLRLGLSNYSIVLDLDDSYKAGNTSFFN